MKNTSNILESKILAFKRKYYVNLLIKQSLVFLSIILLLILVSTSLEFSLEFNSSGRTFLFYFIVLILLFGFFKLILSPYLKIVRTSDQISNEEAAEIIGKFFPEFSDKLLNTIQLDKKSREKDSLALASIEKRTSELSPFEFTESVNFSENKKYVKYVAYPAIIIFLLFLIVPHFLTESSNRIINYDQEFLPVQLFQITPTTDHFSGFKNEDYLVTMKISGSALPDQVYINARGRRAKMILNKDGLLEYKFEKLQDNFTFQIEAADYKSSKYDMEVYQRPDIKQFNISLNYPDYTKIPNKQLENTGNFSLPEGTTVQWTIETIKANDATLSFVDPKKELSLKTEDQIIYKIEQAIQKTTDYSVHLQNEHSANKDSILYHIDVIKDELPKISMDSYQDTTLYSFMIFNGLISDDYGFSNLELVYTLDDQQKRVYIPHQRNLQSQNFFYQWNLDTLGIQEGSDLTYFIRVWDNDQVNGKKYTQTGTYTFNIPKRKELKEKLDKQATGAKKELEKSLQEVEDLNDQIKDIKEELKSKKELDWQENKKISDLIKQKEKLAKELEKIAEQNKQLADKQERFNNPNEKLQKKVKQLEQLMEDLLDDETKKLYEELKKLLSEQKSSDEIEEVMDQIENKEENLEKEIERALEMFKRMQFEYKMDEVINDLDQLQKEQEKLSEETLDRKNDKEDLKEEQEKLNEAFEDIKEELNELEELNENLKDPEQLEDFTKEEETIDQEQEESSESLEDGKRKKSSESQKDAAGEMKKMKEKMSKMQMDMEMSMEQENMENLKDIVDNLVKLSFDQERILIAFKDVSQSDPRYITLSQNQLKLKDDAVVIEDSLLALATRVFQIKSFVTRELDAMNDHITQSLQDLKDRKKSKATTNQQYAMTSINNLTLLLDDVLQQMQQQMAEAMGKPQKGKKGKKQKMPGMSELQKELNKKIEGLKKSGKSGRPLSKELAELAAEQEMLRNGLKKIESELGDKEGGAGGNLKEAIKKMEETELDLVNKRLTQETINRQKDILTRMLKAEDALRERELDKEREADQAREIENQVPPAFEDYIKAKQKELELLNTIPPKMNPYYKDEVNKYFRRLIEQ